VTNTIAEAICPESSKVDQNQESDLSGGGQALSWEHVRPFLRAYWPLLVALLAVYASVLLDLVRDWWQNPDYSHGLLLPFAALFLLYRKRSILSSLRPQPVSWTGAGLMIASQGIFLVGVLGAEFFLQRFSLLLLLAGMILYLRGWAFLKETSFLFLLGLLSIPLPAVIFNSVALPLQLTASSLAEQFLRLLNVPVYREGNILQVSTQMLDVAEACSGIRSLMSLLTLGSLLAYFLPVRWWLRALFVAATVPIALGANAIRIGITGLLALHFGEKAAQGFFHTFEGWIVFVVAFGCLFSLYTIIAKFASNVERPAHS